MTASSYSPGLHQLLTLEVKEVSKLINSKAFTEFSDLLLDKYNLEKIGMSIHNFENNSFTIAICLKESHICIHTWPEFEQLTLDVYLCNYLQDNTTKVKDISKDYIAYFKANVLKDIQINR